MEVREIKCVKPAFQHGCTKTPDCYRILVSLEEIKTEIAELPQSSKLIWPLIFYICAISETPGFVEKSPLKLMTKIPAIGFH
ncbi:hypothetical protein [Pedosphaera parvula]|uniref:Uncharacterized protein n=1 Tax=Pedosphaera parvula (strain Ellin514) TaxID=320771 RepID=B9XR49_PEDPL|nr:hypothetical protein [Pedosphaera parvula]EEF57662.1 hypothetical protein Cflav_PD0697 [Pedosphaera parvula Ellin514]